MTNVKKRRRGERLTLILIPNSGSEARRLSITYKQIQAILIALGATLLLLIIALVNIYSARHTVAEAKRIKAQHDEQMRQAMELNQRLTELEKRRQLIDEQQRQILKLVGSPAASIPSETPSRGGGAVGSRSTAVRSLAAMTAETDMLQRQMADYEVQTQQLFDMALSRLNLIMSVPNRWPLVGRITSTFGWRGSPFRRSRSRQEFHNGIDIAAPRGTAVHAAADGVVIYAGWISGWGRMVKIRHQGGIVTSYAHNSSLLVKEGDRVVKGEIIARVGSSGRSTGPHLHFTIEKNGRPVDPMDYLP